MTVANDAPQGATALRARLAVAAALTRLREYGIVISVAALFVLLAFESNVFFTRTNQLNILDQMAPAGIIACAQTLVIIGGGFDLSVGAMFAMAGVAATLMVSHIGVWPALVFGALVGSGSGP